eukprot:snap_masked-scaffold_23-processed-gene-5.12-mRNA-1 protein AED:1.00 eAED:1.00 QI:0/-1/0/0/-1/1/1/0/366
MDGKNKEINSHNSSAEEVYEEGRSSGSKTRMPKPRQDEKNMYESKRPEENYSTRLYDKSSSGQDHVRKNSKSSSRTKKFKSKSRNTLAEHSRSESDAGTNRKSIEPVDEYQPTNLLPNARFMEKSSRSKSSHNKFLRTSARERVYSDLVKEGMDAGITNKKSSMLTTNSLNFKEKALDVMVDKERWVDEKPKDKRRTIKLIFFTCFSLLLIAIGVSLGTDVLDEILGSSSNVEADTPTLAPTFPQPTFLPSTAPSFTPTVSPTERPTKSPTNFPSLSPTFSPTNTPTKSPTSSPTFSAEFICEQNTATSGFFASCSTNTNIVACSGTVGIPAICSSNDCFCEPGRLVAVSTANDICGIPADECEFI